jgi:hypothetical protein
VYFLIHRHTSLIRKELTTVNRQELLKKSYISMCRQMWKNGCIIPVNLLIDIGILSKKDYAEWLNGNIPSLETVCIDSLNKYSFLIKDLFLFAKGKKLKPFQTCYYRMGQKENGKLRFSKNSPDIEQAYATCYYDQNRVESINWISDGMAMISMQSNE